MKLATPLSCYQIFNSLKLHFQPGRYTIQRYGVRPKWFSQDKLEERNDRYFFKRIANHYQTDENLLYLCAGNMVFNPNIWIGDLEEQEAEDNYFRMKKVVSALPYYVLEDTKCMINTNGSFRASVQAERHCLPAIFEMVLRKEINPETVVVFDRIFNVIEKANHSMSASGSSRLWNQLSNRLIAFRPCVKIGGMEVLEDIKESIKLYLSQSK